MITPDGRDTSQWYSKATLNIEMWWERCHPCFDWNEI